MGYVALKMLSIHKLFENAVHLGIRIVINTFGLDTKPCPVQAEMAAIDSVFI